MILVYGTASSGKSNIAENISVNIAKEQERPLVYLATMESATESAKQRIRKHRKSREGKGFYTIEEPDRLRAHVLSVAGKVVLLECVSNYCANVYFKKYNDAVASDDEIDEMTDEIVSQILMISDSSYETVIVTNDIFRDGIIYDEWTESYMKLLARVNENLAKNTETFYEIINGIPFKIN